MRTKRGIRANGDRIRVARLTKGLTQEQLACDAQIDAKSLRKAERGQERVDVRVLVRIASALRLELTDIVDEVLTESTADKNTSLVRTWHDAFLRGDLENLLALHTDDTLLEIPSANGLPQAGSFRGIEALRVHLEVTFQTFRILAVREDDFEIHVAGNLVFMRTTATIEFIPASKSYTSRYLNEFEIRDGKISRRTVISDYNDLRQIVETHQRESRIR